MRAPAQLFTKKDAAAFTEGQRMYDYILLKYICTYIHFSKILL